MTRVRHATRVWLIAALLTALVTLDIGAAPLAQAGTTVDAAQVSAACPARTPRAGFVDATGTFHEDSIDCVAWYGIAQGRLRGQFEPNAPVRRDQMASFVVRLLERGGARLPSVSGPGFRDVGSGSPHARAIGQLAALDIVRGTGPGTYSPAQPVRRDQMASFLVRAYEHLHGRSLPVSPSGFTDTAGSPHATNIDKARAAGFAAGTTSRTYEPLRAVRREQMATFLARTLGRAVTDRHVTAQSPPAAALTNSSVLHPRGVGLAVAGLTVREVEQRTGTSFRIEGFRDFGRYCYYAQPVGVSRYSFMIISPDRRPVSDPRDGIIATVSTHVFEGGVVPTTAGVRPGDGSGAVRAAYGDLRRTRHLYVLGGVYLDAFTPDRRHGLRFEVDDRGRVTVVHAGRADAIQWPEGCA